MSFRRKPNIPLLAFCLALPLLAVANDVFDPELEDTPQPPASSDTSTNTDTSTVTGGESAPEAEPVPVDVPLPAKKPKIPPKEEPQTPYVERGPSDLKTYLKEGRKPRFLRINVKGHNIRTGPDFSVKRRDNIGFQTKGGELYVVESMQPMAYGAAMEINVDGRNHWVYVPYSRKDDFQVCESEACMSSLADSLDFFLHGSGVSVNQAESCGVSSGPEGLVLPPGAPEPTREPEMNLTSALVPMKPRSQNATNSLSVKPLWEAAKGRQGAQWTRLASNALDKFGQGLLNRRSLSDASTFCPNFSRLNEAQKKEFYIHLLAGIARYESNFRPSTPVFDEDNYKNRTPPYNIYRGRIKPGSYSMGLFQLSYSAAPGYRPQCRIDWSKDRHKDISDPSLTIYDPQIQMECAVTILNRWVSQDGGLGYTRDVRDHRGRMRFRGGANYWSTLRNTNPATKNLIGSLKRFGPCWR